ncbi:MAG: hypothetical protein ACXVZN_07550 [Gaiellaceae bacterium]
MRRRLSLASVALSAALLLVLGLASGAPARTAGRVKLPPLTKAEKAAMTIASIDVKGADNLGVFVTATFKGNFAKTIGTGHLTHAAAALVLVPKPGKALSAGLVTTGAGPVGKLYREAKSTDVGAARNGNKLVFFILGPGYANVQSVEVETIRSATGLPVSTSAVSFGAPNFGPRLWDKFISLHPIDHHVQTADPSGLSCAELKDMLASIDQDLDDPGFHMNVEPDVKAALGRFRNTVQGLFDKCPPPVTPPPAVVGTLAWHFFSSNEVAGSGQFTGPATTFNGIRIVLPTGFVITNHICPSQLPNSAISGNTIACGGGTLTVGQPFALNLQTSPFPTPGMGGQLFGIGTEGAVSGPFPISGP